MSITPEPPSTPGPGVPEPLRPASDPETQPTTPGPPPEESPDPDVDPDVDDVAHEEAPGPDETVRGLQAQPSPTDPSDDDPGSMLNY